MTSNKGKQALRQRLDEKVQQVTGNITPRSNVKDSEEVKVGLLSHQSELDLRWCGQVPINDPPIVAFPIANQKNIMTFNLENDTMVTTLLRKLPYIFSCPNDAYNLIPWVFLDAESLMISGGLRAKKYQNHTYVYSFKNEFLVRKADLLESRIAHGMYQYKQNVYAFSGENNFQPTKSNEVYDIQADTWSQMPDLPTESGILFATVACIGANLYIAGQDCDRVVQFQTGRRRFTVLEITLPSAVENHKVFSNGDSLFVIEADKVIEFTPEGNETAVYKSKKQTANWLAGPPVYFQNKAYFSTNCSDDLHLYTFDFENPDYGLYVSRSNAFELIN